jgi:hypothetical protein
MITLSLKNPFSPSIRVMKSSATSEHNRNDSAKKKEH